MLPRRWREHPVTGFRGSRVPDGALASLKPRATDDDIRRRGVRVKTRTGVVGALLALVLVFGTREAARAVDGCRVTGGGTVDACGPGDSGCDPNTPGSCAPDTCASPALDATHGGQVGAPVGVPTAFTPDSACIAGEWEHVRHIRKGLFGNFHARSFDSLMCACLPCPENRDVQGVAGALCNPGDRICGPEPPRAPANKICFSGPGDYAITQGNRAKRSVVFRVDVEDRGEPGGTNGPPPPDRYRMRMWFVDADSGAGLSLRQAVACADPTTENLTGVPGTSVPTPDIDDGGDLIRGNQQIHPPLKKTCSASGAFLDGATP